MPGAVRVSRREDASVRTSLQTEGLAAISDPRLSNPAKMRKKCCYGRRRTWGQNSSLSPSPTHLSHTSNITLSRIKCERLFFYKEVCSFVHWSSSLYLIMFRIYLLMYVTILCNTASDWKVMIEICLLYTFHAIFDLSKSSLLIRISYYESSLSLSQSSIRSISLWPEEVIGSLLDSGQLKLIGRPLLSVNSRVIYFDVIFSDPLTVRHSS